MRKQNKLTKKQIKILFFLSLLRIFFPLVIFTNPVWGAITMFFLDLIDYQIIVGLYKVKRITYELYDKFLDHYGYILVMLYMLINLEITNIILQFTIFYFIIRTIGEIIFSLIKNEKILIFFPNIFELYFWTWLYNPSLIDTFPENIKLLLVFLLPCKIIHEYVVHFLEWSPSKLWTSKIETSYK